MPSLHRGYKPLHPRRVPLGSALTSLETAIANNLIRDLELQSLFVLIGIPAEAGFGVALTGFYFGMNSCFKGTDRRLLKNATATTAISRRPGSFHIAQSQAGHHGHAAVDLASILPSDLPS